MPTSTLGTRFCHDILRATSSSDARDLPDTLPQRKSPLATTHISDEVENPPPCDPEVTILPRPHSNCASPSSTHLRTMSFSASLPADDTRNPSYWELRAGCPPPNEEFYTGGPVGERQRPVYTKETYVRGLNLTCGEYLRHRESTATKILQMGLLNMKDKISIDYAKASLHRWHYNRLFDPDAAGGLSNIPEFWRDTIVRDFIQSQLDWTREHKLQLTPDGNKIVNLPLKATWRWGPCREGPSFSGLFQLQHMKINMLVPQDGFTLRVLELIEPDTSGATYIPTPKDVDHTRISFEKLEAKLQEINNLPYSPSLHKLVYQHPDLKTHAVQVTSSDILVNALLHCQERMQDTIEMSCISINDPMATTGTTKLAVLPRVQNAEKERRRRC